MDEQSVPAVSPVIKRAKVMMKMRDVEGKKEEYC